MAENNMHLVSIYIPTKNRVDSLKRAVESVVTQTYENIELIIVDDASNDGTNDYLLNLSARDGRIRVIRHDVSTGAPVARNEAILVSNGFFVTGLDDDDAFESYRVEAFVAAWREYEKYGIRPSCLYSQDAIEKGRNSLFFSKKPGSVGVEDLYFHNCVGNQVFAPKSHYVGAGLFDPELPAWQDLEFIIRLVGRYGTALLLDLPSYRFDDSPRHDRISKKSREKIDRAFRHVSEKHAVNSKFHRQALFLQIFSEFYGFKPNFFDFLYFLRLGFSAKGFAKLIKARLR